jgi:hypothetical protein
VRCPTEFNNQLTEAVLCNVTSIGLTVTHPGADYGTADLLAISNALGLALSRVEGEIEWRRMNSERSTA